MRSVFGCLDAVYPERYIMISRSDATTRNGDWERQFLIAFPQFQPVVLSVMSPDEQMRTFMSAKVIVGAHGSGLSCLFFCHPGTMVFEVFESDAWIPMYSRISGVASLSHVCLFCENGLIPRQQIDGIAERLKSAHRNAE